jgi:hypothetical protein
MPSTAAVNLGTSTDSAGGLGLQRAGRLKADGGDDERI